MQTKICTKCGCEKAATVDFFYAQKDGKYGLRADCRICFSAKNKAFKAANPDYDKQRYWKKKKENYGAIQAERRRYYEKHREKCLAYTKARNQGNKDEYNERLRRWRKNNPGKVNVWNRNRRALIKQLAGSHTHQDVMSLLAEQSGKCVYCRINIKQAFHVDHIVPVSAGGRNDKSNLQLLCKPCNLKKNAKDPLDFAKEVGLLV